MKKRKTKELENQSSSNLFQLVNKQTPAAECNLQYCHLASGAPEPELFNAIIFILMVGSCEAQKKRKALCTKMFITALFKIGYFWKQLQSEKIEKQ